jgi:hypothetical protein
MMFPYVNLLANQISYRKNEIFDNLIAYVAMPLALLQFDLVSFDVRKGVLLISGGNEIFPQYKMLFTIIELFICNRGCKPPFHLVW